jgi:aubergine-like protein
MCIKNFRVYFALTEHLMYEIKKVPNVVELGEWYVLQSQLKKIYGGKPHRMAFIIVTKHINTRLFLNGNNPPPGTVVDEVITLPER